MTGGGGPPPAKAMPDCSVRGTYCMHRRFWPPLVNGTLLSTPRCTRARASIAHIRTGDHTVSCLPRLLLFPFRFQVVPRLLELLYITRTYALHAAEFDCEMLPCTGFSVQRHSIRSLVFYCSSVLIHQLYEAGLLVVRDISGSCRHADGSKSNRAARIAPASHR